MELTSKEKILDSKIKEQEEIELFTSSPLFKKYWIDRMGTLIEHCRKEQGGLPKEGESIQNFGLRMAINNNLLGILEKLQLKPFQDIKALGLSIQTRINLK